MTVGCVCSCRLYMFSIHKKPENSQLWGDTEIKKKIGNFALLWPKCSETAFLLLRVDHNVSMSGRADPPGLCPFAAKVMNCGSLLICFHQSVFLFPFRWQCQYLYTKHTFSPTLFLFFQHFHRWSYCILSSGQTILTQRYKKSLLWAVRVHAVHK